MSDLSVGTVAFSNTTTVADKVYRCQSRVGVYTPVEVPKMSSI